jgi:hypothetical protein
MSGTGTETDSQSNVLCGPCPADAARTQTFDFW